MREFLRLFGLLALVILFALLAVISLIVMLASVKTLLCRIMDGAPFGEYALAIIGIVALGVLSASLLVVAMARLINNYSTNKPNTMNKKTANAMKAVARRAATPEQLADERTRALRQKLMSVADAAFIQLAGNPAYADKTPAEVSERAVALAEQWMADVYGLVKKDAEAKEE